MILLYTSIFANACHNGFINVSSKASGQLLWSKPIGEQVGETANVQVLYSVQKSVIVVGIKQMFAFGQDGNLVWQRRKWYGTPVALKDGWIYYISADRKNRMEAVDLQNKIRLQDFKVPDLGDDEYLVMFEPNKDGLIAQVQYTNEPEGPEEIIVYKITKGKVIYDWSKSYENEHSPLLPITCTEHGRIITFTKNDVLIFNINNKERTPEPTAKFNFPLEKETMWVSCGNDGNLYWAGMNDRRTSLVVTDLKGDEKWRWESVRYPRLKQDPPVAPPIITPDRAFLLSQKNLVALQNGKKLWEFVAETDKFSAATALGDNSILVVEGNKLHRLNAQGESLFEVTVDEPIVTFPVVDENGNIYVASSEKLYAIH